MSGKAVACLLVGILFFLRAAGSSLKHGADGGIDMIGIVANAGIGCFWLFAAAKASGAASTARNESGGAPVALILLLLVVPAGGFIWWQMAGPGAKGGSTAVTTSSPTASAPVSSGPTVQDENTKRIEKLASSATLHRAEFDIKKYENSAVLRTISDQLAKTPGVIAAGYEEVPDGKNTVGHILMIFDSAEASADKLISPVEFGFKLKTSDLADSTISGASLQSQVQIGTDGIPRIPQNSAPAAWLTAVGRTTEKEAVVTAAAVAKPVGIWHVAGFRMIPGTATDATWPDKVRSAIKAHSGWYVAPQTAPDPTMVHVLYEPASTKIDDIVAVIKENGGAIQANDDRPCEPPPAATHPTKQ